FFLCVLCHTGTLRQVPNVQVTGVKGRTGNFEVTVNGTLIHSKLDTGSFPETEQVSIEILFVV
uniref:Uncharacterized protein n=1 Tax=Lates calcarifer TaxID=8187 RepID=A0A4W6FF97_LATCA